MVDKQMAFDAMFQGQPFGARGGREPRLWHVEVVNGYDDSSRSWDPASGRHVFSIFAGTGAGKTEAAGHIASLAMNRGLARWLVFVCPNLPILTQARGVFADRFGIHLESFRQARSRGVGSMSHGYIATYSSVVKNATLHRRICGPEFLVVFDEVHHLGDQSAWNAAAEEAFGRVRRFVAMTGTPFRSKDDPRISFVTYEDAPNGRLRFKADFSYPLGRAVAEGVCRRPMFFYHDATVKVSGEDPSKDRTITFADTLPDTPAGERLARERLRGAVRYGSTDRRAMLARALSEIRAAGRKCIIFLGGDTNGDLPTEDARETLPHEIAGLGLGISPGEIEVVVGEDRDANAKIRAFGASDKWILVSVNMVSEGTDIPELSAAILLTSVTAKQTTIQRIGRVLRLMGPGDPYREAWIYLFRDRYLYEIATEAETEIFEEIRRAQARAEREATSGPPPMVRTMAIGVGDGRLVEIACGGDRYTPAEFEDARRELGSIGIPQSWAPELITLRRKRFHAAG